MKWSSLHGEFVSCFLVFARDSRLARLAFQRAPMNESLKLKLMWRKGAQSTWACEKNLGHTWEPSKFTTSKGKTQHFADFKLKSPLIPAFRNKPTWENHSRNRVQLRLGLSNFVHQNPLRHNEFHHKNMVLWSSTSPHLQTQVSRTKIPTGTVPSASPRMPDRTMRPTTETLAVAVAAVARMPARPAQGGCWDPMKPTRRCSHLTFRATLSLLSPTITNHHILALWIDRQKISGYSNLNIFINQ